MKTRSGNCLATIVLAALAALLIAACGDDSDGTETATGNATDRAFVAMMVPHHESALEMAQIAQQRAKSEFVMQLADDIIKTQSAEIDTMKARDKALADAGVQTGSLSMSMEEMGMTGNVSSLKSASPFDAAFLRLMIPHHEGAVVMAKEEIEKGSDPALNELARNIITAQEREIRAMRAKLKAAGGGTGAMQGMHESG